MLGNFNILCYTIFSDLLRGFIVEQVASLMVLPNKFPVKLSEIVEAAELKMPEPEVNNNFLNPHKLLTYICL